VLQVVDASAFGKRGPSECPLEGRGVQLVAGFGHEQTGVCVPISSHGSHERQDSVGNGRDVSFQTWCFSQGGTRYGGKPLKMNQCDWPLSNPIRMYLQF
jgi:hypothetical protein